MFLFHTDIKISDGDKLSRAVVDFDPMGNTSGVLTSTVRIPCQINGRLIGIHLRKDAGVNTTPPTSMTLEIFQKNSTDEDDLVFKKAINVSLVDDTYYLSYDRNLINRAYKNDLTEVQPRFSVTFTYVGLVTTTDYSLCLILETERTN